MTASYSGWKMRQAFSNLLTSIILVFGALAAIAAEPASGPTTKPSIDAYLTGEANLKNIKIVQVFEGTQFKTDWKRSQFLGTFTTRLAGSDGNSKPAEAQVLGPAHITLMSQSGKEVDSDFVLKTVGGSYGVHPSLYSGTSPQYNWKPDKDGEMPVIVVEEVPGHPDVIRATGAYLLVQTKDGQLSSIDASPIFWPGMTWTIGKELSLRVLKDEGPHNILLKPGTYKLDAQGFPHKVGGD